MISLFGNSSVGALAAQISAAMLSVLAPLFPRANTVSGRVLEHFLEGRSLTNNEALSLCSTNRLAADMFALEELGWLIDSTAVEDPTAESPIARIARYLMRPGGIDLVADVGAECVRDVRNRAFGRAIKQAEG